MWKETFSSQARNSLKWEWLSFISSVRNPRDSRVTAAGMTSVTFASCSWPLSVRTSLSVWWSTGCRPTTTTTASPRCRTSPAWRSKETSSWPPSSFRFWSRGANNPENLEPAGVERSRLGYSLPSSGQDVDGSQIMRFVMVPSVIKMTNV